MKSAILFLTYKRYSTSEIVFNAIRKAKPPRLYFSSNAPNPKKEEEAALVNDVRNLVSMVDWPCEVKILFRETFLPAKYSISTAIDWFFQHELEGIILEDDCLPDPTFFRYCDELLDFYREDYRVAMISGNNFQNVNSIGAKSYYFSNYSHIWGWASWRRSWKYYDVECSDWAELKKSRLLKKISSTRAEERFWESTFDSVSRGVIDTWDYQWNLAIWTQGMYSIVPNVNLVSNIGFGEDATNTKKISKHSNMPVIQMHFPLVHPSLLIPNIQADSYTANQFFKKSAIKSFLRKLKS